MYYIYKYTKILFSSSEICICTSFVVPYAATLYRLLVEVWLQFTFELKFKIWTFFDIWFDMTEVVCVPFGFRTNKITSISYYYVLPFSFFRCFGPLCKNLRRKVQEQVATECVCWSQRKGCWWPWHAGILQVQVLALNQLSKWQL